VTTGEHNEEASEETIEDLETPAAELSDVVGGADDPMQYCWTPTCGYTSHECTLETRVVGTREQ
jgi:hypothetical protein